MVYGIKMVKDMDIFSSVVSKDELQKIERKYNDELSSGVISTNVKFHYAWSLVRSRYPADMKKGILLFEELCDENRDGIMDYMYFIAIGKARLKEYAHALEYCRKLLEIDPVNPAVHNLQSVVKKRMDKEGVIGIIITTTFALAVAFAVGLGMAFSKRSPF